MCMEGEKMGKGRGRVRMVTRGKGRDCKQKEDGEGKAD